jgi:diguanylate cyclase (GGDEF)-like protein
VLRAVGQAIRVWAGSLQTCWRLGGDEFVIALPNTDRDEALNQAALLGRAISSILVPIEDTQVRPSISVGIAICPEDGASAGTLLGIADRHMYAAKAIFVHEAQLTASPVA